MRIVLIGLVGIIAGIWLLTQDSSLRLWVGIPLIVVGTVLVIMQLVQSFLEGRTTPTE